MINFKAYGFLILLLFIGLSACKSTKKASRNKAKNKNKVQHTNRPYQPKTVIRPNPSSSQVNVNNKKIGVIEPIKQLPPKSVIVIESPENPTLNPNAKTSTDVLAKKEAPKVNRKAIPPFPYDSVTSIPIPKEKKPAPTSNPIPVAPTPPPPVAPTPPPPSPVAPNPTPAPTPAVAQVTTPRPPAPLEKAENIEKAQILLYLAGFKTGRIDGALKPETIDAITQYQRSKRIPDGDRSALTLNALGVPLMDFSIQDIQQALEDKGYNPGPIDNLVGPKTKAALQSFLQKNKLPLVGLTPATKSALFSKDAKYVIRKAVPIDPLFGNKPPPIEQPDPLLDNSFRSINMNSASILQVQKALLAQGYDPGPMSQVLTPQLEDALFHYQTDKKLPMGGLNEDTLRSLGFSGW